MGRSYADIRCCPLGWLDCLVCHYQRRAAVMNFYVDQVVEFRPRVTGGVAIAVVTGVRHVPFFGMCVDIRITDGTYHYPTGHCETVSVAELTSAN